MTVATLPQPRSLAAAALVIAALWLGAKPTDIAAAAVSAPPPASHRPQAPWRNGVTGACTAKVSLDAALGSVIDVVLPPGWVVEPGLPAQATSHAFGVRLPASGGVVELPLRRLGPDAAPIHAEIHRVGPQGAVTEAWPVTGCGS